MSDLDPSLRAYVDASDAAEAETRLAALIEEQATPLVRRIAARKLNAFGGEGSASRREDLEDIVGDTIVALVSRLRLLREGPDAEPIQRFDDYAAVVTHNAFAHYLRRRHPDRSRLKHRLRYVLKTDHRFRLWRTEEEGAVCGLSGWPPSSPSPDAAAKLARLTAEPDRFLPFAAGRARGRDEETALLEPILTAIGEPLELDRLVAAIGSLTLLRRPRTIDPRTLASLPDGTPSGDRILEGRRRVQRAWNEIGLLPPRQRVALLLNLRDASGSSLLWVLPLIGAASIRQIALVLEMAGEELAQMWDRLPLDDVAIAARLGCTRQQVINLRGAARKRLGNRLGEGGGSGESAAAVNTTGRLASLGDER